MVKKSGFLLLILFSSISILAQQKAFGVMKVGIDELKMQSCPFEPDANAMKLFDVQETEFDISSYTSRLKTERKVRIKIFNEKGYKYASIKIPYLSKKGYGKIKELNGLVYNIGTDGKMSVKKLEKKDFYKENAADNVGIVNFTFPNLKPGSIIEYSYATVETDLIHLNPWVIQDQIPVAYSSFMVTTPVESSIFERVFGTDSIKPTVDLIKYDRFRRTLYSKENIPSFRSEPFMSSIKDHLIKVTFLLFPNGAGYYSNFRDSPNLIWSAAGSRLLNSRYYAEQINKKIAGTEEIIDSAKNIPHLEERLGYVYNTIKKKVSIIKEQTANAENLTEAWKEKAATSAEINLILLNVLDKANVNCLPLLISTRDNGKIDKGFPTLSQINGIDVLVLDSSKFYILDASLKFQSHLNPPLNILNREAFILSKDSMQWVTITDPRPLVKQSVLIFSDFTENGVLEGTASIQYFDYAKAYKLDTTSKDEKNSEETFYDKKPQGLKILSLIQSEIDQEDQPLLETIEFLYEPNKSDDFYFINPQILTEKNKNPFITEKRNTNIDFGCNQLFLLTMHINIPENFTIEHLPKSVIVRAPDSSFFYRINYTADSRMISISQQFEVQRAIFEKEEYTGIQDFFKHMHVLMAEEIVLKKKK